jgi:predicted peptidase
VKQFDGALEAQILYTPENRKKYPAFLFVPQCPPGKSWGGVPGLRNVDSLVFEIIDTLEREFSIDTHRRYVMGHSLGGYGTWYFIGTRPEMFAGAIPSAGFGDPSFGKKIVDVPVWAFHGRLDRNVSVNGSRDIIEAVRKAGGNPRYTEYPNIGHGTCDPMKKTPELMEWLFEQKRE